MELDLHVKISYYTKTSKSRQYKYQWEKPVTITASSCIHTNGCTPCQANRVAVTSASGSYVKKIPTKVVWTLCNFIDKGVKLTHELIKAQVTPIWPKHKVVTGVDTANIRFKIMRAPLSFKELQRDSE